MQDWDLTKDRTLLQILHNSIVLQFLNLVVSVYIEVMINVFRYHVDQFGLIMKLPAEA